MNWPRIAFVVSYTIKSYAHMLNTGNGWPSFRLGSDGRLRHDIPNDAFLDDPVLSDQDHERIASASAGDPLVDDFWWELHARRNRFNWGDMDKALGLDPGTSHERVAMYERRLSLAPGVEAVPAEIPGDKEARNAFWESEVERGLGVGVVSEEPVWTPPSVVAPSDARGAPMTYIGQFRADALTKYAASSLYWLYWSETTQTFTQVDYRD